eukprot:10025044-Heterocapsa_arctica.AAC.1
MASYGEVIPYWEESDGQEEEHQEEALQGTLHFRRPQQQGRQGQREQLREDVRDSLAQKDEEEPQIAAKRRQQS